MIMGRVISLGQIIVDITMRVPHVPDAGQDVFADDQRLLVGASFNLLHAVRCMGVPAQWGGILGTGAMASMITTQLKRDDIAHTGLTDAHRDSGFCVAMTDNDAERTFVSTRGAEAWGEPDAFAAIEAHTGDVVYISGYTLVHRTGVALRAFIDRTPAHERSFIAVFDPGPVISSIDDATLNALIDYRPLWSLNERETMLLAERVLSADVVSHLRADQDHAALTAALAERLQAPVVSRAGAGGACVAEPASTTTVVPGFPVHAVDTNGAGDCHTGVLCAELATGTPLVQATQLANAAASIAVTRHGPATCPAREEALELVARTAS